jgi:hypothetical protein
MSTFDIWSIIDQLLLLTPNNQTAQLINLDLGSSKTPRPFRVIDDLSLRTGNPTHYKYSRDGQTKD